MYYGAYLADDILEQVQNITGLVGTWGSAISTGVGATAAALEEKKNPIVQFWTDNPILATVLAIAAAGGTVAAISWLSSYMGAKRGGRI